MASYVNPHNGNRRQLGKFTPFLGAFFLGPLYFLAKGHWPAALIMAVLYAPLAASAWPLVLFLQFIVAFFARGIMRRHYTTRGYEVAA